MVFTPKPKTSPATKPTKSFDGEKKKFEVRLGAIHTLALLGLIFGCMFVAFSFGFISGQKTGFDSALAAHQSSAAPLPLESESVDRTEEADTRSEVFAKLESPEPEAPKSIDGNNADTSLPEIGSIETKKADLPEEEDIAENIVAEEEKSKEVDTAQDSKIEVLGRGDVFGEEPSKVEIKGRSDVVRVLGEDSKVEKAKTEGEKTLKGLLAEATEAPSTDKKVEHKATATEAVVEKKAEIVAVTKEQPKKVEEVAVAHGAVVENKVAEPTKKTLSSSNPLVTQILPPGWFAQVAAPREMKDATELSQKLKESGFPVIIEQADVRGEQYFRVLVGPEQVRAQAQELFNQLKRERYLSGEPFLRLVR